MSINRIRRFVMGFGLIVALALAGLAVFVSALQSQSEPGNAGSPVISRIPRSSMGVSGPIEQGDAGFGSVALVSLLPRSMGVSGPVEQGDAGFD